MREYCINVEGNEKLKAKVTNNEEYASKLLKKKTQAEEQYLKIITGQCITIYWVIFEELNFHILPKIELSQKIIFANDPRGHVERCGVATLSWN